MTITLSTFKATRGNLQSYGDPSAVLKVMVLDETVIDNEDELVVKVTDLSSEVTGGTYAATTLTGVDWDLTGDQPALRADDVTIEGLDLPGPSPLPRYYVVFCDDHDDSDRIDDLVAILEATPAAVVGDQPISWPGGIIATIEQGEGDADARLDLIEAWTVAGVPFVDGDVDAEDLAAALAAFIGSGGTTVQSIDKTGETPGVVNIDLSTGADAVADDVAVVAIMGPSGGDCEFVVTPPVRSNGLALGIYAYCPGHFATITIPASGPLDEVSYGPVVVPVVELVNGALAQTPASGGGGAVDSVNGQTGVVVLDADDIGDGTTNKAYTAAEQSKLAAISGTNTGDQTLPTLASLGAVPTSRTLAGLDLSADRTASALRTALGLVIGTDVLAPNGSGASLTGIPESAVTNLVTDLAAKAPLASPALTGSPTAPTASAGTSTTQVATTAFVTAAANAIQPIPYPTPSGSYLANYPTNGATTCTALAASGRLIISHMWIGAGAWDRIGVNATSTATATWRLGWYPISSTGDPDWANVFDAGQENMSTGGFITINRTPGAGWYFAAILVDAYTANPTVNLFSSAPMPVRGFPQQISAATVPSLTWTGVATGALPTSSPGTPTINPQMPCVWIRKA